MWRAITALYSVQSIAIICLPHAETIGWILRNTLVTNHASRRHQSVRSWAVSRHGISLSFSGCV